MERSYVFIPRGFEKLREEIQTIRRPMFKRLYEQCELYKKEVLPEEHPLKSITYYGMAAANLSMAYKLTGQKQYLEEAKRWIFQGIAYEHWGRAVKVDVDLSAAWLLFGYSLCYNWIKESLTEDESIRLRDKLLLQGQRMYKYAVENEGKSWVAQYWQNHNWIDYTGLAMAGYVLKDECPEVTAWIDKARENMRFVFTLLSDDGSDYEGVVYWRYGVIWLLLYSELLRDRENIDFFKESDFLRNTFFYRLYQAAPNLEEIVNFGDCHDRRSGHSIAMYYKFASEYNIGHAQWLANEVSRGIIWREAYESGIKPGILPEAFLELLWYNPDIKPESIENLPCTRYFPDLGLISTRSGWDKDAVLLSFKAAPGGGHKQWKKSFELDEKTGWSTRGTGHHHPDSNSFILMGYDNYLVIDEGYNKHKLALDHNVVLVDNQGYINEEVNTNDAYKGMPFDAQAKIEAFACCDDFVYMVGEASKLYKRPLKLNKYERSIIGTGRGYYIIQDELKSDLEHTYTWLMHSDAQAENTDSKTFEVRNGKARLNILNLTAIDNIHYNKITKVTANPTSQEPTLIIEQNMKTLCIENKKPLKDMRFLNVLAVSNIFDQEMICAKYLPGEGYGIIKVTKGNSTEFIVYNESESFFNVDLNIGFKAMKLSTDARWTAILFEGDKAVRLMGYAGSSMNLDGLEMECIKKAESLSVYNEAYRCSPSL